MKICKCDHHEAGHEHEDCDCGMCDMKHGKQTEKKDGNARNIVSRFFIKNPPCHTKESNHITVIFGADLFFTGGETFYHKLKQKNIRNDNKPIIESLVLDRFEKPS
ncbi:MAG: hypothetical protein OEZ13_11750 [Spirochaetia bacterium]|nr:hypothetical protein [Spirochaetia bacterium]